MLHFANFTRLVGNAAAAFVLAGSLTGCAGLLLVNSIGTLVNGPVPDPQREAETNRQTLPYPVDLVYATLISVVERDGRRIISSDTEARRLRVSYPFSWLQNNWGGVLTITCTSNEQLDEAVTTVQIAGGARDALFRIRALGNGILKDLDDDLDRRARAQ